MGFMLLKKTLIRSVQFELEIYQAKIEMGLALMAVNLRKYMQHVAAI